MHKHKVAIVRPLALRTLCLRRFAGVLIAALALAVPPGTVRAQAIGDDLDAFLDASGAVPVTDEEAAFRLGGFDLDVRAPDEVLASVTIDGALDEQGVSDAAGMLAIATGYGAGIEQPIATFLGDRAGEFAGAGPVSISVEAYTLELDLQDDPLSGTLTLSRPRIDPEAFGPPVATLGSDDAPVVVRVFSDFQCPACRRYALQIQPGLEQGMLADGEVRFAFHHLPLASIHANAVPAAEAAQCTADLFGNEAFWAYHDLLFERQTAWQGLDDAGAYLARLVGDVDAELLEPSTGGEGAEDAAEGARERLAACIEAGDARASVAAARDVAAELGLASTPSVFVGSYRLNEFGTPAAYGRLARLELAEREAGSDGAP